MLRIKKSFEFIPTLMCDVFLFCLSIIISLFFIIFNKARISVGIKTLVVLLFAALFVFFIFFLSKIAMGQEEAVLACNDGIILSEIFPFTEEFVELYNAGIEKCSLNRWSISDELGSASSDKHRKYFENVEIIAGGYAIIRGNLYLNDDGDLVKLYDADSLEVQRKEYVKSFDKNNSYSFVGSNWNWMTKTPNEENKKENKDEIIDTPKIYSDKIIINEIFPAPLKNSELVEFVELYSSSDKIENLEGWYLKDRAGKTCVLTGNIIDPITARFLVVKNNADKKCTLALNDTQGEFLGLYNPNDAAAVFSVSYEGSAKKGRSYNFNGSAWSWSQFLTEGKENIFNSEPYGKIKIDEDVFVDVYADFSVSTGDGNGDKVKISWDFGDNHKSSLAKTRHKYENVGIYNGSVKLSDGSEDVLQNFIVEVKKFPHPDVVITTINANPAGSDSEFETITIENKSKKKIDLNGWSVATGSKTLVNHPISEKLTLKKKEIKVITREFSKFTLNNKKGKIELRYPDGKVASKIKYDHGKTSIEENEIYQKVKGGWVWVGAKQDTIIKKQPARIATQSVAGGDTKNSAQETIIKQQETNNSQDTNSNNQTDTGIVVVERENKLLVKNNEFVKIELLKNTPRVLGAETVREIDGIYFFTSEVPQKEHYAVSFFKNIFASLNLQLNNLLNFFIILLYKVKR
ncbi:MAG TPA: hypothetical protein DDY21_04250 [Candidatus Moranbacteria bacterium]|nr:hypothetical protein [Candidatus Moranbacteria bacterium]HCO99734.1 hypothetical protein [Candidatus Moranbacteria bacterium]